MGKFQVKKFKVGDKVKLIGKGKDWYIRNSRYNRFSKKTLEENPDLAGSITDENFNEHYKSYSYVITFDITKDQLSTYEYDQGIELIPNNGPDHFRKWFIKFSWVYNNFLDFFKI